MEKEQIKIREDLTGQVFGKWTVMSREADAVSEKGFHTPKWLCLCECGKKKTVSHYSLVNNGTKSCGKCKVSTEDLTGNTFGKLLVLNREEDYVTKKRHHQDRWLCKCLVCGENYIFKGSVLRDGSRQICPPCDGVHGRWHGSKKLAGKVFGKLTVIKQDGYYINPSNGSRAAKWLCKCVCGKECTVSTTQLTSGRRASCQWCSGHIKHNESNTRLYRIWRGMVNRSTVETDLRYPDYGGRWTGEKIEKDWLKYIHFRSWALTNGYQNNLSIERVDNDRGYFPNNCVWADAYQQNQNKRNVVKLEFNGESKPISVWARDLGISEAAIRNRVRWGYSAEQALATPVRERKANKISEVNNGG